MVGSIFRVFPPDRRLCFVKSDWTCYSVAPIALLTREAFGSVHAERLVVVFLSANAVATACEPIILSRLGLRRTVLFGALLLMIGSVVKSGGMPPIIQAKLEKGHGEWRVYLGFFLVGLCKWTRRESLFRVRSLLGKLTCYPLVCFSSTPVPVYTSAAFCVLVSREGANDGNRDCAELESSRNRVRVHLRHTLGYHFRRHSQLLRIAFDFVNPDILGRFNPVRRCPANTPVRHGTCHARNLGRRIAKHRDALPKHWWQSARRRFERAFFVREEHFASLQQLQPRLERQRSLEKQV
jgi:hypothetical protein